MIKIKPHYIFLYAIGAFLLLFGQRDFWEGILEEQKQKEIAKKQSEEAKIASEKKFEVQNLSYDSITKTWKNAGHYFQTIHVGNVNFKAIKASQKSSKTVIETNDDENASDSL